MNSSKESVAMFLMKWIFKSGSYRFIAYNTFDIYITYTDYPVKKRKLAIIDLKMHSSEDPLTGSI